MVCPNFSAVSTRSCLDTLAVSLDPRDGRNPCRRHTHEHGSLSNDIPEPHHSPLLLVDERNRRPDGYPDARHFLSHPSHRYRRGAEDERGGTADDGVFRSGRPGNDRVSQTRSSDRHAG